MLSLRGAKIWRLGAPLGAAALLSIMVASTHASGVVTAPKPEPLAFTVPAGDGYGIGECMKSGSECGQVMAKSWCQSHGHSRVIAFGSADDVTGAIPASDKVFQVASGDVIIQCGD